MVEQLAIVSQGGTWLVVDVEVGGTVVAMASCVCVCVCVGGGRDRFLRSKCQSAHINRRAQVLYVDTHTPVSILQLGWVTLKSGYPTALVQ